MWQFVPHGAAIRVGLGYRQVRNVIANGHMLALSSLVFMLDNAAALAATQAARGFDNRSNGLVVQGDMNHDRSFFEKTWTAEMGLGPVFNGESCVECHNDPVPGGYSKVTVTRAGVFDGQHYFDLPGGSLFHEKAILPSIQETVPSAANVIVKRLSTSLLGAGYVEAIADETLLGIARRQAAETHGDIEGEAVMVDVLEAPGLKKVGRFGWKSQHATLLSFCGDAFHSEMGVSNSVVPTEITSNGQSLAAYDIRADPESNGWEVQLVAEFIRATKAPPRDARLERSATVKAGSKLFDSVGCGVCHVPTLTTARTGSLLAGIASAVPAALRSKTIHPYSDFLLHDIGTGDGIVQNGPASTRNKMRTAPLWGLRIRSEFLHDGSAHTLAEAIERHRGTASKVVERYKALTKGQQARLLKFLRSL